MRQRKGQAILEYLLMVVMIAVSIAVIMRSSNQTIYQFWTGLTRQIASPCHECTLENPP